MQSTLRGHDIQFRRSAMLGRVPRKRGLGKSLTSFSGQSFYVCNQRRVSTPVMARTLIYQVIRRSAVQSTLLGGTTNNIGDQTMLGRVP